MTWITTADHPEPAGGRPILVTGSPRSGTTFVGRMLALSPEVHYIHEPFHPRFGPEVTAARFRQFYTYLGDGSADAVLKPLARTMALHYDLGPALRRARRPANARRAVRQWHEFNRARRRGARALVKDPAALFSSEWLADTFQMKVIVLIAIPLRLRRVTSAWAGTSTLALEPSSRSPRSWTPCWLTTATKSERSPAKCTRRSNGWRCGGSSCTTRSIYFARGGLNGPTSGMRTWRQSPWRRSAMYTGDLTSYLAPRRASRSLP